MTTKKALRLPKTTLPKKYYLHLHTDFETHTFTGEETIEISVEKEIKKIVLHAVDLAIGKVFVRQGVSTYEGKVVQDIKNEIISISFKNPIKKGIAYLDIDFSGKLSDSLAGFYKSTYQEDGITKTIATTQFEATDARRVFPCFDEPDKKAIFEVTLSVPKRMTAVSNTMPVKKVVHSKSHNSIHFSPTPVMSTYLLAFIIGDFEYIEKKTKRGIRVRVYTTRGKKRQGVFALSCAVKSIDFYEQYFGINYPLPVLDMIAIPDFAAGAMENWGAVTYRETALLFDENESSLAVKQYVAIVVAHELAHQWFGNLVTMNWWTDLWLNEGFASYMEYLCVDALFPEWHMWEQFVADNLGGALMLDALKNTHPVEVPVHHPDEISEVFDAISYEKGASLIRMLAHYIGEENFQKGVQHYLKKHSYKNTITKDLWASFEQVSKKPVTKIMKEWTVKAGHPIVMVEQDIQKGCTCLSQKRFFINPKENKASNSTDVWPIPLSYKDESGEHRMVFDKKSTTIKMEALEYINLGQTGVYRALYDKATLEALAQRIRRGELSPEERLGVVRDIHASVRNCSMKLEEALIFLEYLRDERHYTVWSEMVSLLTHIRFVYQGTKQSKNIEKYIRYFVDTIYIYVGYSKRKGESHTDTLLRTLILGLVVSTGDKVAIQKGVKLFSSKQIDPDIRSTVYAAVVKSGNNKLFDKLCTRYATAHMHEEKNRLARARIGTASRREFIATLNWILSGEVRSQDIPMYLAQSLYNRYNKEHSLAFVLKKWDMLVQKYSGDKYTRSRIISALDAFDMIDDFKKIKKFFETHEHRGAERTLKQSLETIEANIAFKKYHQRGIEKLFA